MELLQKDRTELLSTTLAGTEYPALGKRYFRRLIDERRIPYVKIGGRVYLRAQDIEALISAGTVEAER